MIHIDCEGKPVEILYTYLTENFQKLKFWVALLDQVYYRLDKIPSSAAEQKILTQKICKTYSKFFGGLLEEEKVASVLNNKKQLQDIILKTRSFLIRFEHLRTRMNTILKRGKQLFSLYSMKAHVDKAAQALKYSDPREITDSVSEGAEAIQDLLKILKELAKLDTIPMVGQLFGCYLQFFQSMNGVFQRVRNYARQIHRKSGIIEKGFNKAQIWNSRNEKYLNLK